MEQQLTTEPTPAVTENHPQSGGLLEQWADNPRMRHIPAVEWMIRKIDVELRQRLAILTAPLLAMPVDDPRRAPIEAELLLICKAADRVASAARASAKQTLQPPDLLGRTGAALSQAVTCLRTL